MPALDVGWSAGAAFDTDSVPQPFSRRTSVTTGAPAPPYRQAFSSNSSSASRSSAALPRTMTGSTAPSARERPAPAARARMRSVHSRASPSSSTSSLSGMVGAGLGLGQQEQLIDSAPHLLRGPCRSVAAPVDCGSSPGSSSQPVELRLAEHERERSADLVRRFLDELAIALLGFLEARRATG